jgi:V/A-type H+-transporting ATPase subunit E
MSEDLQSILEKINREGVEKAEAEAKKIIDAAKAKAAEITAAAAADAARVKAEADKAAAQYAERAGETIRQAARDTVISVERAVTAMLERLLVKDVETALADENNAAALALEAVKDLTGNAEISVAGRMTAAFKARLAAMKNVTVVTDETAGSGFSVKLDGGRIEHDFSAEVIAGELAKRLRPDLAKLVRQ